MQFQRRLVLSMFVVCMAVLTLAGVSAAQGFLIDRGNLTHDPRTGKSWLDLTLTTNRSFSDVAAKFGPGAEFDGFRHADSQEVFQLWEDAGIQDAPFSQIFLTQQKLAPLRRFQELFGITADASQPSFGRFVSTGIGRTVISFSPQSVFLPFIEIIDRPGDDADQGSAGESSLDKNTASPGAGHWLIRTELGSGFGPGNPLSATSSDGMTDVHTEQDGSGVWFSGIQAEGFDVLELDGEAKILDVGIVASDPEAVFLVSDDENGPREVVSGGFVDFPVPVGSFRILSTSGGGAGLPVVVDPVFIEALFLRFDRGTVSFEKTAVGEVKDLCEGKLCDDGNSCTDDFCNSGNGECFTEPAEAGVACASDDNVCTDDVCDGSGSCVHQSNDAICDDGFFCNGFDSCAEGSCSVHEGDPCLGNGECEDVCDEDQDNCFGAAFQSCTDDEDLCTNDFCDAAGSCTHPLNDDAVCGEDATRLCEVRLEAPENAAPSQIRFSVAYDREKGSFVGETGDCEPLGAEEGWSFTNDRGFEALDVFYDGEPILTPVELLRCTYATISDPVVAQDFVVGGGIDAGLGRGGVEPDPVLVQVASIRCQGCSTPKTGSGVPLASDCLFILRAAVGSEDCDLCICDNSGDERVLASDALRCLRKAVGQDLDLSCPVCDSSKKK